MEPAGASNPSPCADMGSEGLSVPVLFLVYNRPEIAAVAFERVRAARPVRLYVAADGPRADRPEDLQRCLRTRDVATAVDWPCEIKTLFREGNLGLRRAVSGALDWFFENEAAGIVLEDDCVPSGSFFRFCAELLDRYRDDERVMVITGNNFQMGKRKSPDSYYFSRYTHCVGWASWDRAWRHYEHDMRSWPEARQKGLLRAILGRQDLAGYWTAKFDAAWREEVDSWAYRWTLSCWLRDGLTATPSKNLVANIGFGQEGTHTRGDRSHPLSWMRAEELDFPLRHPAAVVRDDRADWRTHRNLFSPGILSRLARRVRRSVGFGGRR